MPEKWTGDLVGLMHNKRIKNSDLAAALGYTESYVSMVLNGIRTPENAEQTFRNAVDELIAEKTTT